MARMAQLSPPDTGTTLLILALLHAPHALRAINIRNKKKSHAFFVMCFGISVRVFTTLHDNSQVYAIISFT